MVAGMRDDAQLYRVLEDLLAQRDRAGAVRAAPEACADEEMSVAEMYGEVLIPLLARPTAPAPAPSRWPRRI